jgi:hypothetical protein
MVDSARPKATRASLERLTPMPSMRRRVEIQRAFTADEVGRLEYGMMPRSMDDHWFAFLEDDWLYFHRSWSGICKYMVKVVRAPDGSAQIGEAWANMKERVTLTLDYDVRMLRYLIERVLGNDWPFPT